MIGSALISADGFYRFELRRSWDDGLLCAAWVMLNPSTADGETDDQTIRRCVAFTQAAGYGSLVVVNLYALRATNPAELAAHPDPVGRANLAAVRGALFECALVVAAWGSHPMARRSTIRLKLREMVPDTRPVVCLGKSGRGDPLHPARLGNDRVFLPFTLP